MSIITPSLWLADLTKKSFLREYPITAVHNSIDSDIFKPTESNFKNENGLEGKKIVLGVASVWTESKGLSDYLKLSQMLNGDYAVVLVGLSERQIAGLRGRMKNSGEVRETAQGVMIDQTNAAPVLAITRTNSPAELAEIYTAADVFVNLTYEDNYPTVNLEAQACGTPCITYRTGGSPESVPSANVVECGDLDGIVALIENRLTDLAIQKPEQNKSNVI